MKELLGQAYSMYDLVIFDMPPILAVTDAQIMAMYVMLLFLLFVVNQQRKKQQ